MAYVSICWMVIVPLLYRYEATKTCHQEILLYSNCLVASNSQTHLSSTPESLTAPSEKIGLAAAKPLAFL